MKQDNTKFKWKIIYMLKNKIGKKGNKILNNKNGKIKQNEKLKEKYLM